MGQGVSKQSWGSPTETFGDDVNASLYDRSVKCFEDDRDEVVTLGTFDLFEGLDVVVFGAVHDGEDLGDEGVFATGPLAGLTHIRGFHRLTSFFMTGSRGSSRIKSIDLGLVKL